MDFIWPKFCVVCDKEGNFLCQKCKKKLPGPFQICPMCTGPSIYGLTHEYCRKKNGLNGLIAIFEYKDQRVKKAVEAIKFGFNREMVSILLKGWKAPENWKKAILVPVPLHRYRENWRGFNQAELIAREVGGKAVAVVSALKKTRSTVQQASITNKKQRLENLKNCFEVDKEKLELLRGKNVVLVDDIFTSGATMRACAKVLHKSGIKKVWGFCLAR